LGTARAGYRLVRHADDDRVAYHAQRGIGDHVLSTTRAVRPSDYFEPPRAHHLVQDGETRRYCGLVDRSTSTDDTRGHLGGVFWHRLIDHVGACPFGAAFWGG